MTPRIRSAFVAFLVAWALLAASTAWAQVDVSSPPPSAPSDPFEMDRTFHDDGRVFAHELEYKHVVLGDVLTYDDGRVVRVEEAMTGGSSNGYQSSVDNDVYNAEFHVILTRYLENGALDRSFGRAGVVVSPYFATRSGVPRAILDGDRIVVAGASKVAAYLADGSLDSGFGSGGTVDIPASYLIRSLLLGHHPDGASHYTLVSEERTSYGAVYMNGDRYQPSGALDPSLRASYNAGPNGSFVGGALLFAPNLGHDVLVVAMNSYMYETPNDDVLNSYVIGFDGAGAAPIGNTSDNTRPYGEIVHTRGQQIRAITGGRIGSNGQSTLLYTVDGSICFKTIGDDGAVQNGRCTATGVAHALEAFVGAVLQPDGRFVVGYTRDRESESNEGLYFIRVSAGYLDLSAKSVFRDVRHSQLHFEQRFEPWVFAGLAIDAQRRWVVAGAHANYETGDRGLARLLGDSVTTSAPACTDDWCGASEVAAQQSSVDVEGVLGVSLKIESIDFGAMVSGQRGSDQPVGDVFYWNTLPGSTNWTASVAASNMTGSAGGSLPFTSLTYGPGSNVVAEAGSPGLPVPGTRRKFQGAASGDFSTPLLLLTAQPGERGLYRQSGGALKLDVPATATQQRYTGTLQYTILN